MRLSVCREAERTYSLFHSSSIGQIKLLTADEAPQAALTCGMRDLEDGVTVARGIVEQASEFGMRRVHR